MRTRSGRVSSNAVFRPPTTAIESEETTFERTQRKLVLAEYLDRAESPTPDLAWRFIYELLLWIEPQTGMVSGFDNCATLDSKCAGRFHQWLADQFAVSAASLDSRLDFVFRFVRAERNLRRSYLERWPTLSTFKSGNYTERIGAGELLEVIKTALQPYFLVEPPSSAFSQVSLCLREYWNQENKRKNLLGEGFEDVLAAVVNAAVSHGIEARTRTSIADIPGFYAPGAKDKATKVDLVVEHQKWTRPALVNVKWSIRADHEDQLWDDFKEYVRFDRDHRGFDHYLVTNEFDPARLNAVCDRREVNSFVFKQVVHINTDGLLAAYGTGSTSELATDKVQSESSMQRVRQQVLQGRLVGISKWLTALQGTVRP